MSKKHLIDDKTAMVYTRYWAVIGKDIKHKNSEIVDEPKDVEVIKRLLNNTKPLAIYSIKTVDFKRYLTLSDSLVIVASPDSLELIYEDPDNRLKSFKGKLLVKPQLFDYQVAMEMNTKNLRRFVQKNLAGEYINVIFGDKRNMILEGEDFEYVQTGRIVPYDYPSFK